MKKIQILSLIIAGAVIALFSCTKENNESVETNNCPSCQDGIELANKINNFKQRLAYAKENVYKDGDEITKEEAIENMELLFNASYGFPAEKYKQIAIDTVVFTLPVNEQGFVAITDVATSYDQMFDLVKSVYDSKSFNDKHIVSVILFSDESNTINAIATTGEKQIDPGNGPFQDCYWYGELLGMCDYTGAGETDGAIELRNELFENRPSIVCPSGYHVVTELDYSNTFEGNEPLSEGYIFYMEKDYDLQFTNPEKQLIASEMNYWYAKEYEFLFTVLPQSLNKPYNWLLVSLKINGDEHYIQFDKRWINHQNDVVYGLAHCVKDEVLAPPTNP